MAKKSGLPRRRLCRSTGFSLMEEVVVVAIIAMLVVLGVPAVRTFFKSMESEGGTRAMISAALSSGRAIAAKEQHYAGIRFENKYQPDGKGCQYMIFIIYDPGLPGMQGNLGCQVVEGMEPIKLPDSVGVMEVIGDNSEIDDDDKVMDKTTFSVLFSPSGKLIIHNLWVRNKDGVSDDSSKDDVFNSLTNVRDNNIGMFLQDVSGSPNLPIEPSRNSFIIYDKTIFEKLDSGSRFTNYIGNLEVIYINPYTGTIINR